MITGVLVLLMAIAAAAMGWCFGHAVGYVEGTRDEFLRSVSGKDVKQETWHN